MPTAFWMCGRLGSSLIWSYYTCFIWNTVNKKTISAFPSSRLQSVFACLVSLWLIYDASLIGCWDAISCRECSPGDYQRNFETNDNFPYLPPATCFTSLQSDQTKPYHVCPVSQNSWTSCTRIARSVHLILETIECSINWGGPKVSNSTPKATSQGFRWISIPRKQDSKFSKHKSVAHSHHQPLALTMVG